jgi:rubrerythrin
MDLFLKQWICAHCGFYAKFRFINDICPVCKQTDWHCDECGHTLTAKVAPSNCPQCGLMNCFSNISCYIPDWPVPPKVGIIPKNGWKTF